MTISLNRTKRYGFLAAVGIIISIALLGRVNYRLAEQRPAESDFLVHWLGTRLFITEGVSPYSDEAARKIQLQVYGRPARDGEQKFHLASPFYSQLIFAPFALIPDYALARAVWMTFAQITVIATALLSMRLTRWQPGRWLLPFFLIFSLLWYHGLGTVVIGNAVVVVSLLIVAALVSIRENRDILAGIFLALATIKPHLMILPLVCIFIWAVSRKRRGLIGWTLGSVIVLTLLGMAFLPDWLLKNISVVLKFSEFNPALSFGAAFQSWWPGIGVQLKWGLAIFLAVLLVVEWWSVWGKGFPHFLWTFCLTLAVSQWLGIAADPGNFILLFLPIVLVFSIWRERWGKSGDWIVFFVLLLLFTGLWALFINTLEKGGHQVQQAVMFLPMPIFSIFTLYWIRWWVLRPTRHILDLSNPQ